MFKMDTTDRQITTEELKAEVKKYPHLVMDFILDYAIKNYPYSILELLKKNKVLK